MLGPALLVTPCLHQGATTVKGHFPTSNGTMWRDWYTHKPLANLVDGQADIPSPLGHIPLHIRSGGILLLHVESKYTLAETRKEPLELVVSLDDSAEANGVFYLDDGLSLESKFASADSR
jgi:alpha-glucosidase (family GH31 glycosyl hydrolase)